MSMQKHHLDTYDAHLAEYRPFGDSDYLHEQLQLRYQRRLGQLSTFLPLAGELSRALERVKAPARYRTVGDPVVRHTIQQALRRVVRGAQDGMLLAECEDVFRKTLRHLDNGTCGGPLESGGDKDRRLGQEAYHGWIWSDGHSDDIFDRTFRKVARDYFPAEEPCAPSATDLAKLEKGAELLRLLLPLTSRSALGHAHVIVTFNGRKASCSEFRVGGTVFINRDMLHNPWWVAEHLLHESLHQKLYDFRHTHTLLARDLSADRNSSAEGGAPIYSLWNAGGADRPNYWDTFRGIAAFHVYVHLALLCLQAERRKEELFERFGAPDASPPSLIHWHKAFERAQYLGRAIKESAWKELGPAGQLLVDWLLSTLNAIDASPPPANSSYLHLLLERYVVEASLIANTKLSLEATLQLEKIVRREADVVHHVLSALHAGQPELDRLDDAGVRRSDEGAEAHFLRFRGLIAKTLQRLSPDGYGFQRPSSVDSTALEDMLQTMVETSSRALLTLDTPVRVLAEATP